MNCREYARANGFEIVGKLKRMPDKYYGVQNSHYPWFIDEAGNEYDMSDDGRGCVCIVTADGGVI